LPTPPAAASPCTQKAGRHPAPGHVRLAEDVLAVGRERLRPVDDLASVASRSAGTRRHAPSQDSAKRSRSGSNSVRGSRSGSGVSHGTGIARVAADQQAAGLRPEVCDVVRVPTVGTSSTGGSRGSRDDVLVAHRDDRDDDARHPADHARRRARRVDDDLGADRPPFGLDRCHASAVHRDPPVTRVLRAEPDAVAARALGQREREQRRIEVAVAGQPRGARARRRRRGAAGGRAFSAGDSSSSASRRCSAALACRWSSSTRSVVVAMSEAADPRASRDRDP
jgi:hypothetical protein